MYLGAFLRLAQSLATIYIFARVHKKYPTRRLYKVSEQGIKKGRISINLFLWY